MAITPAKMEQNPVRKSKKGSVAGQAAVRTLGIAVAVIGIGLMATNKETVDLYGLTITAKYSYSDAFRYFVIVNSVACVLSVLSLGCFFYCVRLANPKRKNYFLVFLIDLMVLALALTGSAAATAVGYVGRYGNTHTLWLPICGKFGKFCDRTTLSIAFSLVSSALYMVTTVLSAWKSGEPQV